MRGGGLAGGLRGEPVDDGEGRRGLESLKKRLSICVCVCYNHIYIYIYIHTHTYTYIYIYIYTHAIVVYCILCMCMRFMCIPRELAKTTADAASQR